METKEERIKRLLELQDSQISQISQVPQYDLSFISDRKSTELKPDWSKVPSYALPTKQEDNSVVSNIANRFNERVDLFKRNPVAGGIETANDVLGSMSLPFILGEKGIRAIPYVGEPLGNAISLPFQAIGQGEIGRAHV